MSAIPRPAAFVDAPVKPERKKRRKARVRRSERVSRRQQRPAPQQPEKAPLLPEGIDWVVMAWIGVIHLGLLAVPFTFSWTALALVFGLHWLTGGIGICLGYHRLFTHSSFSTYRPVRWAIAMIGNLAGEGPVTSWVADHRKHHALSDKEGDPHSPHDGAWWSHMLWISRRKSPEVYNKHLAKWAPDIQKDPVLRAIGAAFLPTHFVFAGILAAIGYATGGWWFAASLVTYGVFLRMAFVLHSTWLVNSASHMWGYVNYKTTDDSKNNWLVAIFTYGEGWHNNHHAYPRMANHGHQWWEFDITFTTIRLMKMCGLAWDVVDYKKRSDKKTA